MHIPLHFTVEVLRKIALLLGLVCLLAPADGLAQEKHKKKIPLKDTLDGKLDVSAYLVEAHGFLPIPFVITEPALGGIGGALVPMFISPNKHATPEMGYVPPNITAAAGMYTGNGSWGTGAFRSASLPKIGMKYQVGIAYGDVNLAFYRQLPVVGERKFEFGIKALPIFVSLSKKIGHSALYAGIKYRWMDTKLSPRFSGNLPDFIKPIEMDSKSGTMGVFLDYDKRNTVFTPDKGIRAKLAFNWDDNWTGSDYQFQKLKESFLLYQPINSWWVGGLRLEGNQAFNDPPFYLQPGIDMRGVPAARYQGQETYLVETEQRFDLTSRWSVLAFGGWGTVVGKEESFGKGQNVYNAGGGFRYLLARLFKLRLGIDVAKGPDSWGWYIIVGHSWNR